MTSNYGRELWEKDKAHFLHPWTHFDSFNADGALVVDRGEGSYIYDVDGKRYLDAVGGLWCTNIGLGREEMADAIAQQVRKMAYASAFVDLTNPPAAELAAKLAELASAMESAGVTLVKGDLAGIVRARHLSRATMGNIRQNLFFAFFYNALGVPVAAGVLYPFVGLLLSPIIAAAAMSLSSVSVVGNALRLRHAKL